MTSLHSVEYLYNGVQYTLLTKTKQELSVLSLEIIDSILRNKITIIFSQGPLNLTPLISSIYSISMNSDVLVGLPKKTFRSTYSKYTKIFFSLLYRKKMKKIPSKPLYFYENIIWCNGKVDEVKNELINIHIETNPLHGSMDYKKRYESFMTKKLESRDAHTMRKILYIPVDNSLPTGIIGKYQLYFEKNRYKLSKFDPELIILESINERAYSFDNLLRLIRNIKCLGKKLVLHFSWPYLQGADDFLKQLEPEKEIAVYHFGKAFCLNLKNRLNKPPDYALEMSIEGNSWGSIYYPNENKWSNIKIILPYFQNFSNKQTPKDVAEFEWLLDKRVANIWTAITYNNINDKFVEYLLKFPLVIDSFLCPSEIKIKTFLEEIKSWRYIPIRQFIESKLSENNSTVLQRFIGLCSEVENCKDISEFMLGLVTYSFVCKKTLFQTYLIEILQEILFEFKKGYHLYINKTKTTNLIIANLHPNISTVRNLKNSIHLLFNIIKNIVKKIQSPKIVKNNGKIIVRNKYSEFIIYDENKFLNLKKSNFKESIFFPFKYPVRQDVTIKSDYLEYKIFVNLETEYVYFSPGDTNIRKTSMDFEIYQLKIFSDGTFEEIKFSDFEISQNSYQRDVLITFNIEKRGNTTTSLKCQLIFYVLDFSQIQKLTIKEIQNSKLLIPGPIPFCTIYRNKIALIQGYDSLLLPFNEIVFFAYPGRNLKILLKQLNIYTNLVSDISSKVAQMDLLHSLKYMSRLRKIQISVPKTFDDLSFYLTNSKESFIDDVFRHRIINDTSVDTDEKNEIKTLKQIWESIGNRRNIIEKKQDGYIHYSPEGFVSLRVSFNDGHLEDVSFPSGTLIRKRQNDEYILCPIEEIVEEDTILYIETSTRESVDNFLLRDFLIDQDISIEEILEPFTCLKIFYETLKSIKRHEIYKTEQMKKIYWLNEKQRESLFKVIQALIMGKKIKELEKIIDSNFIWFGHVNPKILYEIFRVGKRRITYRKLYLIAKQFNISITENAFKTLCSFAIQEQRHYYFRRENNLLALGQLLGHQGIINNYIKINEMGKKIGVILQIIGRSISRVISGKGDPLNEMDLSIEDKLHSCDVVEIIIK